MAPDADPQDNDQRGDRRSDDGGPRRNRDASRNRGSTPARNRARQRPSADSSPRPGDRRQAGDRNRSRSGADRTRRPRGPGSDDRRRSARDGSDRRPGRHPSATPEDEAPKTAGPKQWGSLGRKGAARLAPTEPGHRRLSQEPDERPDRRTETARWERVEPQRTGANPRDDRRNAPPPRDRSDGDLDGKPRRGRARRPAGAGTGGADARSELERALGPQRGARAADRLRDAAHAFERDRFEEARDRLRPIAEAAPGAPSVRELLGLTHYRLGRWTDAIRELEAFRELTRTTEQHPVLADAHRALGRHGTVEQLWTELKEASPSRELVTEGRIVMAGSLADRGRLQEAIDLLTRAMRGIRDPRPDDMRQAYALGDLYEQAGEVARARELFGWLARLDRGFADAAERAADLG